MKNTTDSHTQTAFRPLGSVSVPNFLRRTEEICNVHQNSLILPTNCIRSLFKDKPKKSQISPQSETTLMSTHSTCDHLNVNNRDVVEITSKEPESGTHKDKQTYFYPQLSKRKKVDQAVQASETTFHEGFSHQTVKKTQNYFCSQISKPMKVDKAVQVSEITVIRLNYDPNDVCSTNELTGNEMDQRKKPFQFDKHNFKLPIPPHVTKFTDDDPERKGWASTPSEYDRLWNPAIICQAGRMKSRMNFNPNVNPADFGCPVETESGSKDQEESKDQEDSKVKEEIPAETPSPPETQQRRPGTDVDAAKRRKKIIFTACCISLIILIIVIFGTYVIIRYVILD